MTRKINEHVSHFDLVTRHVSRATQMAAGVGIAPTPPVLHAGVQTDYTIQRIGLVFGFPRESVPRGWLRISLRSASRNRTWMRRMGLARRRKSGGRSNETGVFMLIPL